MSLHTHTGDSERRSSGRFPIAEEICYRIVDQRGGQRDGSGTTVDMAPGGIRFHTDTPPTQGRLLEVAVNWPVALQGTCPLKLVAVGRVVRSDANVAVLRIQKYQFKTRGRVLARTA
jgi:hypothetical protein